MTQTLQILQLILFSIPILALLGIGGKILKKTVSIINRRWFLCVFLPLLLANPLIILESYSIEDSLIPADWRLWLILITDLALIVGITWVFRGFMVIGLNQSEVKNIIFCGLQDRGHKVKSHTGKKQVLLGRVWNALILTISTNGHQEDIWITEGFNEVLIRVDSSAGLGILKHVLPALRTEEKPSNFKARTLGFLYIVLAVVFAVLSWILFFEPRLIVIL